MAYTPGTLQIKRAELKNVRGDKTVDISRIASEINLYEDLMNPVMYGTMILEDGLELLSEFPIIGDETFTLEFRSSPENPYLKAQFRTFKISNIQRTEDKMQTYTIHFTSQEMFDNMAKSVVDGLSGTVSQIAKRVYNDYLNNGKPFETESTSGNFEIAFPYMTPFASMRLLARRARSTENPASDYVFYEDRNGFYFKTVHGFMVNDPVADYHYMPVNLTVNQEMDHLSVREFEIIQYRDVIKSIEQGMFESELILHDMISKRHSTHTYNYQSQFQQIKHLEKHPLTSVDHRSGERLLMPSPFHAGNLSYVGSRGRVVSENYESFFMEKMSAFAQLDTIILEITIHGDERRKPGDIIRFHIPPATELSFADRQRHKYLDGKYLISRLRHKINLHQYVCMAQIVKDSSPTDVNI